MPRLAGTKARSGRMSEDARTQSSVPEGKVGRFGTKPSTVRGRPATRRTAPGEGRPPKSRWPRLSVSTAPPTSEGLEKVRPATGRVPKTSKKASSTAAAPAVAAPRGPSATTRPES